ncbi:MAG: efflux RND transporter periplasmic adaptor subunit [Ignavibacteriaceae bacterium]|jgi:Cu(I)/Ag(I) efflux system membrane fusion protein
MKTIKNFFTSTIIHQPLYIMMLLMVLFIGCSTKGKNEQTLAKEKDYWTCPMHPQIHADRPGACPICGMDLIKKVVDEKEEPTTDKDMTNMITLSSRKQALANVSTVVVKKENLQEQITAYSYLDFVENNRKTISARFNGRIEKLFVDKTGDYIKKGQALFEIYSPDLVQAQNEYLIALANRTTHSSLVSAAKMKLELFGLTAQQIQTLEQSKEIKITLTYFSPISGTVIEKKVQEGAYVNEGTAIYDVAELSTLWNIAEVYENDLSNVKIGSPVKLHLRAYPGQEFNGRVTFIYPVVNAQTRTVKVSSEFSSNGGKLKPQMYGETIFSASGGQGLLVPADAVIIAGQRTVVWVKTGDGMFEARSVQIGNRFGDKYQILSGLNEGDEIAATGGFLIDSESQLKTGLPTGNQHEGTNQKKSSSDEMNGMGM